MRHIILALAIVVAACTPSPSNQIETEFDQRIQTGGLSGPALADAYIDRGLLRLATRNPDGAIADFNLAIQTVPDLTEAYVWRGVAKGEKGDKAGARGDYDRALAIDPDYWFAHGNSGLMLAEAGEDDAALAELARALELGMPHRGEFFVRESRQRQIMQINRKGPPSTGTESAKLAISASDQLALYRVTRAGIFLKRGDKDAALAESREAASFAPDSFFVQMNLIRVLSQLGQCEEAWRQMDLMGKKTGIYFYQPKGKAKCPEVAIF